MNIDLNRKRAFISGSTAGIGFAIAKGLAAAGAEVILNGRKDDTVRGAIERMKKALPQAKVRGVAADLASAGGAEKVFAAVDDLDILINNVGIFAPKPFFEIPDEDWERFFQVNVMSGVRLSRHFVPGMVRRRWGRVQFISSESGVQIPAEMVHYGMTKTAMLAVSRGLAESVAGTGVTVNAVLPGPTRSEGVADFVESLGKQQGKSFEAVEKEFFQSMRPSSLLKRFASTDEVASMCVYLASEQASATTGSALRVDGGVVRSAF
jgi:NAD(P)-dependent dehydrogenase (short-subunit alcohol dehydrogenase family)